jgi:hypothetical protein
MSTGVVATAGEVVAISCGTARMQRLVGTALGQPLANTGTDDLGPPTVEVTVEASRVSFDVRRLRSVTRDAWSDGARTVLRNACGSGFDLQIRVDDEPSCLKVAARYRPTLTVRMANTVLSHRFVLLAGQTLIHYPVLWRAGWRDRVPLHVAALATAAGAPLLVGPGGVGKSTAVARASGAGATVTADNICVGDGSACYGLTEPLRIDGGGRRRVTSHGRTDTVLSARVPKLIPDRLIVLQRGPQTRIEAITADDAARDLVAGTYAAGELRRYWQFAATLALATGLGPAHPPVIEMSAGYSKSLPCSRIQVGDGDLLSVDELCGAA